MRRRGRFVAPWRLALTGIGLYMSRQIVERHLHGRPEVRNVEGGAEFLLITPLAPA
jgi:signal transduction histidine kinase